MPTSIGRGNCFRVYLKLFINAAWLMASSTADANFRFKHKLLSLDATLIPLCLSLFDWAHYRRSKGAVKLHLVLDHDGYLPRFAVITDSKSSDIDVARGLEFEPGTMLVIDRGYQDFSWWLELSRRKVFFVTRLKDDAEYGIVEQRNTDRDGGILRDEVVILIKLQETGPVALMRRIEVWVEDKQESIVFFTNHLKLAASTIAAIYRDRWHVELFFKELKQSSRIKTFVGTSANAVMIQIWTALIAMLLVKYLQSRSTFPWSLSKSDRVAAPPTLCLSRLDGMAERTLPAAPANGNRRATASAIGLSWTATFGIPRGGLVLKMAKLHNLTRLATIRPLHHFR